MLLPKNLKAMGAKKGKNNIGRRPLNGRALRSLLSNGRQEPSPGSEA
jgi:hypothetical protein